MDDTLIVLAVLLLIVCIRFAVLGIRFLIGGMNEEEVGITMTMHSKSDGCSILIISVGTSSQAALYFLFALLEQFVMRCKAHIVPFTIIMSVIITEHVFLCHQGDMDGEEELEQFKDVLLISPGAQTCDA